MRAPACFAGLASLLVLVAPALPASAQDVAVAEALFDKGLADMEAGKFSTGCPALAESYRLDPRPGTLFTMAECEAKAGRIATAVARYEDYLQLFSRLTADQQAKQKGREKTSAAQKAALAPQVPKLTLVLPASAPKGTVVKRDDVELGSPSLGLALPVDPGDHVITTQAPGGPVNEQRVSIAKGETKKIELEVKAADGTTPGAVPPPGSTGAAPGNASSQPLTYPEEATARGRSQRTWAFVAGGVGVAGLVVGGVTGGMTLGKKGTIEDNCDGTKCNHQGKVAADRAKTLGLVSTIGFGVGIAGVAAGAILFFTAPKARREAARASWEAGVDLGPAGGAINVGRAF